MSSFISAASVASGQVQSLDGLRAHALPSDAMILASANQVNPTNQNTGSYAIVESSGNFTIPTTGVTGSVPAVTQSPFADVYKEGSIYFNGTVGNYISNTATALMGTQWNTTGMTVEAWVNYPTFTGAGGAPILIGGFTPTTGTYQWGFGVTTSGTVAFGYLTGTFNTIATTATVSTNTWNHIAFSCVPGGATANIYINGIQSATTSIAGGVLVNQTTLLTMGQQNSASPSLNAYVADVRITTGAALYTGSSFTVPSAPLSLAASGTTQFLLRAGQNSPTIQNGALTFDRGLRQYQNYGPQTFNIATRGFTAMFRYTWNGTVSSYERIFTFTGTTANTNNALTAARNASAGQLHLVYYVGGVATVLAYSGTLNQGTNYVVAFVYNPSVGSGTGQWWINGSPSGSPITSLSSSVTSDLLTPFTFVGCDHTGAGSFTSMTSNTFAIYNRALSNVEIYNSYLALNTVPATPQQKTLEIGDINGVPALSVAGNGQVSVQSIGLSSNVLPWPPAAMTGYDTVINGGVYKARDSSEFNATLFGAWQAFDKTNANQWSSGQTYSTSAPYAYTGTFTTTDVNGTVYPGEWLQIQLPNPVTVSSYSIYGVNGSNQMPGKWAVLGSRDGVNWFLVDSLKSSILYTAASGYSSFTVSSTQASYTYYRIVVNQISGNSTYQNATIQEWTLYGTADASPSLTIAPATTFNTSVATPSLTGIAASGVYVPQDFSSSGLNIPAYVVSNTATTANTVQYSSFGPFAGEGSLYFPGGTGAYVQFPASTAPATMSPVTPFTAEAWVYFTAYPPTGGAAIFESAQLPMSSAENWGVYITSTGGLNGFVYNTLGAATNAPTISTLALNSWNHVALTYDGTSVRVFLNGTSSGPTTFSGTPRLLTNSYFWVGLNSVGSFGKPTNAYIACARIVSGQALYTATFTPPTQSLQPIQGTTQAGLPYGTVLLLRNAPAPGRIQTTRLTGSNSVGLGGAPQVLSFPPAAMTGYSTALNAGYGQGTYVASASSEYGSGTPVWYAFTKSTSSGSPWASGATFSGSTPYASTATTTVDISGNSYQGEWIQIQQPSSIVLSSYSIINYIGDSSKGPGKWALLGSRDGANWFLLDSRSGVPWSSSTLTYTVSSGQAFTYLRLIVNQLTGGGTVVQMSGLIFNGTLEAINITNDGRVGLGVVNPTRALEVAGDVVCGGTLSAGNPLMFRNALYNGDFRIAQRGTSFPGGGGYLLDRWKISSYGAGGAYYTVSQIQSGLANFSNALQLQQTSTNSMFFFLQQSLETRDVVRFQGQPVTVSFWYKIPTSFTGSIYAQLNWSTAVDTPLTDIGISYTTAGSLTLTNQTAWTYATFTTFVPSTAQALSVMFTNYPPGGSTVNGATIQITGVQLEKGTVATPFEVRPYATELALCQRYWEQSYALGTAAGTNTAVGVVQLYGSSDSGGNMVATQRYQVAKRIAVTPTIYTTSGTAGSWTYVRSGASGNGTINDNSFSSVFGYNFYIAVGAAWVPCFIQGQWVANAEL